jgi:hypothetical protein
MILVGMEDLADRYIGNTYYKQTLGKQLKILKDILAVPSIRDLYLQRLGGEHLKGLLDYIDTLNNGVASLELWDGGIWGKLARRVPGVLLSGKIYTAAKNSVNAIMLMGQEGSLRISPMPALSQKQMDLVFKYLPALKARRYQQQDPVLARSLSEAQRVDKRPLFGEDLSAWSHYINEKALAMIPMVDANTIAAVYYPQVKAVLDGKSKETMEQLRRRLTFEMTLYQTSDNPALRSMLQKEMQKKGILSSIIMFQNEEWQKSRGLLYDYERVRRGELGKAAFGARALAYMLHRVVFQWLTYSGMRFAVNLIRGDDGDDDEDQNIAETISIAIALAKSSPYSALAIGAIEAMGGVNYLYELINDQFDTSLKKKSVGVSVFDALGTTGSYMRDISNNAGYLYRQVVDEKSATQSSPEEKALMLFGSVAAVFGATYLPQLINAGAGLANMLEDDPDMTISGALRILGRSEYTSEKIAGTLNEDSNANSKPQNFIAMQRDKAAKMKAKLRK